MSKRKRKSAATGAGPTFAESWWLIPVGVMALVLVVFVVWRAMSMPVQDLNRSGWAKAADGKPPVIEGLPQASDVLQKTRFSIIGDDGERFAAAGAQWLEVVPLADPPARAEIAFFYQRSQAEELFSSFPGFGAKDASPVGDESRTWNGRILFRHGTVVTRVLPTNGADARRAAEEIDAALVKTFGDKP